MKNSVTLLSLVLLLFCCEIGKAQEGFVDGVEFTTIKAPWTLRIMGHDLDITKVQAKPDEKSAYFMMVSEKLNVSVFIEPAVKCKSSEECRDYVLNLGNPAWGKFQDLAKSKIKDFSYFEFYRPEVKGHPIKVFDMYAQDVDQGYWIDVHISKTLYKKEDHKLFENLMNSIGFISKNTTSEPAFTAQKAKAERSSNSWLDLWDNKKCGDSFVAMSSITRAENTKESWVDYCNKITSSVGQKSSRTLIASAYTRSLMPKTDRPLAILAYHSNFAKRSSVIEIIGLVLEKEGKWTVSNYIPQ